MKSYISPQMKSILSTFILNCPVLRNTGLNNKGVIKLYQSIKKLIITITPAMVTIPVIKGLIPGKNSASPGRR